MGWPEIVETAAAGGKDEGSISTSLGLAAESSAALERKARIAFGLYLVLAIVAWFTLDGTVRVYGRPVELRLVPLVVLGGLAARTLLAVKAEKIRRASLHVHGEESLKG
jgi:hypothetical protein